MKRFLALTLTLMLALSLTACESLNIGVGGGGRGNPVGGPGGANDAQNDPDYFIGTMDTIVAEGDEWDEGGMGYQSAYFYRLAGSGISSFRFAVESLLWLLGEGDSIDDITEGSRYADWDQIARISWASPFAYYFEGLLVHYQGEEDRAVELYTNAYLNPMVPEDGFDFYYLRYMEVADLYALRDRLREKEDEIYGKFREGLQLSECPRHKFNFSGEYLQALAREALEAGDTETADIYAQAALIADPFSVDSFKIAALCALTGERLYEAGGYIDEGLSLAPNDPTLCALRDAVMKLYEEVMAK